MKSEDRHKLQHNWLADHLAIAMEKTKPYQNAILGGIILLLAVYILHSVWNRSSANKMDEASTQFHSALHDSLTANDPSELQEIAKTYPDTAVGYLAALTAADMHLQNGSNQQFLNKATANKELSAATETYEKVLPRLTNPLLVARAKFGLARAKECQNELPEAEKLYADIVDKSPDGAYKVLASHRLEDLKRPSTKSIYDKFANFNPSAFKDDTLPLDKNSLLDPNSLTLPKEGPVYTPGAFSEKIGIKTENTEKKDDLKGDDLLKEKSPLEGDQPAPESTKPAEGDKPAETPPVTPPASETPAPEKTPAPADNSK